MKLGVRWNLRGVRPEAREAARKAARRSGMSVGDWLNEAITGQAAEDGVFEVADGDADNPAAETDREFPSIGARIAESIERIDRRLDTISTRLGAAEPQPNRPAEPTSAGPGAYVPRRHLPQPNQWTPPPPPRQAAEPPRQVATLPRKDWSSDVDSAVAEIAARIRALDTDSDSPAAPSHPTLVPEAMPAGPAPEWPSAATAPQWASPAVEIRHWAPPPPPAQPAVDLSGLEKQLQYITGQIEKLNRAATSNEALAELRNELREIARTVTEAMPRQAMEALEGEMRRLTDRLAQSHQAGAEPGLIGDMARNLLDVREHLRTLTPAENLAGFTDTIKALAQKIDTFSMPGHGAADAGNIGQLESAIGALRGVVSHVASNETLGHLAGEVKSLSARIEQIAAKAADRTLSPELEAQLRAFTEQLQRQNEQNPFDQLQDRITSLATKLDASDARLGHLDTIERDLRGIIDQLGEIRGRGDAQDAAAGMPNVDTLKRDVSRTQDSVEAVHSTVENVVGRLAMIEDEIRENRPHRDTPKPVPAPQAAMPAAAPESPEPAPKTMQAAPKATPPAPRERKPINPNLPPDYPLEPGSGTPQARILSAADRIAASESALGGSRAPSGATNFIAAARRAAKSASAQVPQPISDERSAAPKSLTQRMRRLLGGGAAILLIAAGGYYAAPKLLDPFGAFALLDTTTTDPVVASKALEPDEEDADADITAPLTQPAGPQAAAPAVETVQPVQPVRPAESARAAAATPLPAPVATPAPAPSAVPSAAPAPDITASIPKAAPALTKPTLDLPDFPPDSGASAKFPASLREAAAAGDPFAAYDIAMRHLDGRGVPASTEEAARWLQIAAKGGLAPAQFRLGSLYEKGQGVKKNLDAARQLYKAAAERGNAKAMHNLAVLYAEGLNGKPDYGTAAIWFMKAAEHGVADSQYNLGILFARGIGVDQNLPESYKWFALAADQGDKDSLKKRDDVAARLDARALDAAKLAVKSFVPQPQPDEAVTVKLPAETSAHPSAPARPKKPASAQTKISPS